MISQASSNLERSEKKGFPDRDPVPDFLHQFHVPFCERRGCQGQMMLSDSPKQSYPGHKGMRGFLKKAGRNLRQKEEVVLGRDREEILMTICQGGENKIKKKTTAEP